MAPIFFIGFLVLKSLNFYIFVRWEIYVFQFRNTNCLQITD